MKQPLLKLACSALLGAAIAGSAFTGTAQAQSAGSLAIPLIAPAAETSLTAEQVNHRHWRRDWRHHHRRHYRHYRGGPGFYFNFGTGRFSITVPSSRYYHYHRYHGYPRASHSRHTRWCYARYRSYRHWDNTYQPYHGPRRQCVSPHY